MEKDIIRVCSRHDDWSDQCLFDFLSLLFVHCLKLGDYACHSVVLHYEGDSVEFTWETRRAFRKYKLRSALYAGFLESLANEQMRTYVFVQSFLPGERDFSKLILEISTIILLIFKVTVQRGAKEKLAALCSIVRHSFEALRQSDLN